MMKTFLRLIPLLLTVSFILSLIACGKDEPTPTETEGQPTYNTPKTIELSINGVSIENYTLVYASHLYKGKTRKLYTEYDFFKLTAEHIAEEIKEQTGVTLTVSQDSATDVSDCEILVGPTNRAESSDYVGMNVYKYSVKLSGSKLAVGGGYDSTSLTGGLKTSYAYGSTYHAWDAVKDYIASAGAADGKVDLPADFALSGKCDLKTVACIGDSITEGWASTDANVNAYPAALQRLLWQDYVVLNYGASGLTMRDDLGDHYKGSSQYNAARKNASTFDIALIMLGTNDSNRDRSWSSADDKAFKDGANGLVSMLRKSNDDLKVIIMSSPAYYGNDAFASDQIIKLQGELVGELSASGVDTGYFDMRSYTADKIGQKYFPDSLHPNDQGYYMIAKGLADAIPSMISGEWDCKPA